MSPIITKKILTEIRLDLQPLNILFHTLSLASKLERELIKDYKIGQATTSWTWQPSKTTSLSSVSLVNGQVTTEAAENTRVALGSS